MINIKGGKSLYIFNENMNISGSYPISVSRNLKSLSSTNQHSMVSNFFEVDYSVNINLEPVPLGEFLEDLKYVFKKYGIISIVESELVYNKDVDKISVSNVKFILSRKDNTFRKR